MRRDPKLFLSTSWRSFLHFPGVQTALLLLMPLVAVAGSDQPMCDSEAGEIVLVIIGASYAQNWSIDSIAGYRVTNVGIGGNRSFEMNSRFDRDVLERAPQAVIIWGFIGDIFRSSPEDFDKTFGRVKESYKKMIDRAEGNGIRIFLVTEVTIREPRGIKNWFAGVLGRLRGKESYQSQINARVIEINSWLEEFARSRKLPVLDFQSVLSDADDRRKESYATVDGSHLTKAAYDALTSFAEARIRPAC